MQIDYTALRSIKSGHAVDTAYSIDIELTQNDKSFSPIGKELTTLSGASKFVSYSDNEQHKITTVFVTLTGTPSFEDMREFLDSVCHGEYFDLDISGATETYTLSRFTSPYRETRLALLSDTFSYSFAVKKV